MCSPVLTDVGSGAGVKPPSQLLPPPPTNQDKKPIIVSFVKKSKKFAVFLKIYTICRTNLHLRTVKYSHISQRGGWHPVPPPGRWSKRIVSPQTRRAPMPVDASVEMVTVNLGFLGGTISRDTERHFTEVKTLYLSKLCWDTDSVLFIHSCVTYLSFVLANSWYYIYL